MAEGRQRADWKHTSALLAWIQNTQCTRKADLVQPSDLDPTAPRKPERRISMKEFLDSLGDGPRG